MVIHTCESCNYSTVYEWVYKRHMTSKKHAINQNSEINTPYACNLCSKKYNCKSGLWRHSQVCKPTNLSDVTEKIHPQSENTVLMTALLEAIAKLNARLDTIESLVTINNNNNNTVNIYLNYPNIHFDKAIYP